MNTDPNSPEKLVTVPTDIEAGALITALAAYGVEANSTGGYTAGFRAEAPGSVQIWVRRQDLEKARAALEKIDQSSEEIDWSQVDVGKPDDA